MLPLRSAPGFSSCAADPARTSFRPPVSGSLVARDVRVARYTRFASHNASARATTPTHTWRSPNQVVSWAQRHRLPPSHDTSSLPATSPAPEQLHRQVISSGRSAHCQLTVASEAMYGRMQRIAGQWLLAHSCSSAAGIAVLSMPPAPLTEHAGHQAPDQHHLEQGPRCLFCRTTRRLRAMNQARFGQCLPAR